MPKPFVCPISTELAETLENRLNAHARLMLAALKVEGTEQIDLAQRSCIEAREALKLHQSEHGCQPGEIASAAKSR